MTKVFFFCGVGGSGMSALASLMRAKGMIVKGSDRANDRGESKETFDILRSNGVSLYLQDGSGVTDDVSAVIVSGAVESHIQDVRVAREKNIPILTRAQLLAALFNEQDGIAIGGTSGKTTVTAMIGHILYEAKQSPTIVNGGIMPNFMVNKSVSLGNFHVGEGKWFVAETDESDGSIAYYKPQIAVLNNISMDHKPIEELRPLFLNFVNLAKTGCVINLDDGESISLLPDITSEKMTFSLMSQHADIWASDIVQEKLHLEFNVHIESKTLPASLQMFGTHNVANALAATAACMMAGVSVEESIGALKTFKGIKRRLQVMGSENGVTVIDDFAHNPDKIKAALQAVKKFATRVITIYQPHGYAPTKLMQEDLINTFINNMSEQDVLIMPEIYYAGGTAEKTTSSKQIVYAVQDAGFDARFISMRADIITFVQRNFRAGDVIIVMGARDDSLTHLAETILHKVKTTKLP